MHRVGNTDQNQYYTVRGNKKTDKCLRNVILHRFFASDIQIVMNRIVREKSLCLHFQLFVYVLATLRSDWGYGFTTNTYIVTHKLLSCTKKERFVWRWKSINYFGVRVSRKSKKRPFLYEQRKKWKWIWIICKYLLQQICLWFFS